MHHLHARASCMHLCCPRLCVDTMLRGIGACGLCTLQHTRLDGCTPLCARGVRGCRVVDRSKLLAIYAMEDSEDDELERPGELGGGSLIAELSTHGVGGRNPKAPQKQVMFSFRI